MEYGEWSMEESGIWIVEYGVEWNMEESVHLKDCSSSLLPVLQRSSSVPVPANLFYGPNPDKYLVGKSRRF